MQTFKSNGWSIFAVASILAAVAVYGVVSESWTAPPQLRAGENAQSVLEQGDKTTPQKRAEALGIKFEKLEPGYLNRCAKAGKLLFTSGHTSKIKGRLGKDLKTEDGYKAAREAGVEVLRAVWNTHGTLDNLRVIKVLGCVNSDPSFTDQHKVINGCSDLLHEIFGAKTDGWHARSALGFASLPNGCAVEIEAIFEIKD
jgi:enamine deaminase RidA (YjgF/YER057c/UK114 family)